MNPSILVGWACLLGQLVAPCASVAQPQVEWQNCLGGSDLDGAADACQTIDGSYVAAIKTRSIDGNISCNHGVFDIWVVKLSTFGSIVWQRCLGGTSAEEPWAVKATTDGGVVVAGSTSSTDGDIVGHNGYIDAWIIKLDASGSIQWQNCLGGSGQDHLRSIVQTSDGGYIAAGITNSVNGDVQGNHGGADAWVVRLSANGFLQWQRCFGGSDMDFAMSVHPLGEGSVIVGSTYSTDGDVTTSYGGGDLWVVRLDGGGVLLWQRSMGGSQWDGANGVYCSMDEGIIISGSTSSSDGDVIGQHGLWDAWVVRLDLNGTAIWSRCFGGSGYDMGSGIAARTEGGFVCAGWTDSSDGDVIGLNGGSDVWFVAFDENGTMEWQACYGGSGSETANSIRQTQDLGFLLAGHTNSIDGDVSGFHGYEDAWVLKLGPDEVGLPSTIKQPVIQIAPNPAVDIVTVLSPETTINRITVSELSGRILIDFNSLENRAIVNVESLCAGSYVITAHLESGAYCSRRLVLN